MNLSNEELLEIYSLMVTIREFEDKVLELCRKNIVPGIAQLCNGQEAAAVGSVFPLRPDDYVIATYRGHGQCIAKGSRLHPMMAEILGKKTGCCKGKGGPMHLTDMALGNPGLHPIVGANIPIGTGIAMGLKRQQRDSVCLIDFGDGAVQQGVFHESLNMAALWDLPAIYVCENNLYAVSVPFGEASAIDHVADRACAYGIPGVRVDGMDVLEVLKATQDAIKRARQGKGPTLIECETYRYVGHSQFDPDDGTNYRSREEIELWRERDPIPRFRSWLRKLNEIGEETLTEVEKQVRQRVSAAASQALKEEMPAADEAFDDMFADFELPEEQCRD